MSEFLDDTNFEKFRNTIYRESGINFTHANRAILESRLKERLRTLELRSLGQYHRVITREKKEMRAFLDSITTNLTRFFRNSAHMEAFEHYVLPALTAAKRDTDAAVRVWSAGCSSGEEPYSIAMVMKENLPANFSISVIGSDISLKSLMVGREGYYPESRVKNVPEKYLTKYFERHRSGRRICDEIRDLVTFDYHNLKHDSGLHRQDVVFCRNVLIYFDEAAQRATIDRLWDVMAPYSFLFIGHSESLFGMNTKFEFLKTNWACLYRKNAARSGGPP